MSLTRSMFVQGSVIDNSPRTPIQLWSDDHSAAPCHWVIDRDLLEDTKADVAVKALLDLFLPVEGDLTGSVHCHRCGLLIHKDAEWGRVFHQVERLVFTTIEGAAFEPVHDVLF